MKPKRPDLADVTLQDAGGGADHGAVVVTVTNSTNDPAVAPVILESSVPLYFWMDGKKLSPAPSKTVAVQVAIPRVSSKKFTVEWQDPTKEIKFIQLRARFKTARSNEIEIG